MQIFVKAPDSLAFTLDVEMRDTIEDIKNKIEQKIGVPKCQQCLVYHNRITVNWFKLQDYSIENSPTFNLIYFGDGNQNLFPQYKKQYLNDYHSQRYTHSQKNSHSHGKTHSRRNTYSQIYTQLNPSIKKLFELLHRNTYTHICPYGCGRQIPDEFKGCTELLAEYPDYFELKNSQ